MKFYKKPYSFAITYSLLILALTIFILLKAFVISEVVTIVAVDDRPLEKEEIGEVSITENSYVDDNIQINISTDYIDDSEVYIVDIVLSDISYLQTAFANNAYGKNITATTSSIAAANDAILAINGDYYGFRDYGYVVRDGIIYRDNYSDDTDTAMVIYDDGSMASVVESEVSAQSLVDDGALEVLSFGPILIQDGNIVVDDSSSSHLNNKNPRTAIGMISPLHYVIVVADGRSSSSEGLKLSSLASIMADLGCSEAYNLDGGGSSTLYFNGEVINNPSENSLTGERKVSDIVYVGY